VLESVRKGKALLVLIASDASSNTQKRLTDKANYRHVPVQTLPFDMTELGHALGKDHTVAVAITQEGFVISYTKACSAK
ncbi:MAG: ribosomal L7Ae/L30e/S12e/Gadd45 family protein, partial [Clostridia bacterium]|nr:ribosomal L7Ae/L30e/S12e/Gadd45 family protein [Clostridia bacterium]